jgi:hypothetical protein
MKSYFTLIFFLFSGLYPLTFLTGGMIAVDGFNYFVTLLLGVFLPWTFPAEASEWSKTFGIPIVLIILVITIRFLLDSAVVPSLEPGPWKMAYLSGMFYLVYFVFRKHLSQESVYTVIDQFLSVALVVSSINILQWLFPKWVIFAGASTFSEHRTEVGETFQRFQTVYYHFAVLSLMLVVFLFTNHVKSGHGRPFLLLSFFLSSVAILVNGYRATIFVLLACLLAYFLRIMRNLSWRVRTVTILASLPLILIMYSYTSERNAQTESVEGEESSLVFRLVEAGLGIEKLSSDDAWLFGVGYRDGILNDWGGVDGGQNTYFLHNGYVSVLYNYGLAGAVAWLSLIVGVIAYIIRNLRGNKDNALFVILALYLLGQLAVNYSSGIFNREPPVTFCFFFALALLETVVQGMVPAGTVQSNISSDGTSTQT